GGLEFQVLSDPVSMARSGKTLTGMHGDSPDAPLKAGLVVADEINQAPFELGHWRSLTSTTMRETQQAISDLLRMDYDTFVNSAYLKQGRADEFTTRPPSERKQVLSEILGLAFFDRIQESCKLKSRESKLRIELLAEGLKGIPEIESLRDQTDATWKEEAIALLKVDERKKQQEPLVAEKKRRVVDMENSQLARANIQDQLEALDRDLENLRGQENELSSRIERLTELIEGSQHIEAQFQRFVKVKDLIEALDKKELAQEKLIEQRQANKSQLADLRSRLEVELEHSQRKLGELGKRREHLVRDTANGDKLEADFGDYKELLDTESLLSIKQDSYARLLNRAKELESIVTESRIKLEAKIAQLQSTLADLNEMVDSEPALQEQKQALEAAAFEMDNLESEFELVEQKGLLVASEIKVVEEKSFEMARRIAENQEKIKELKYHDHTSICPLCSAPIVDRAAVIGRYEDEIEKLGNEIVALSRQKNDIEEERDQLRQQYRISKARLAERKNLDKQIGQFNERFEAVKRAATSFRSVTLELEALKGRHESENFAQVERESLINIKSEIHKLEFDPVIHAEIQSRLRMKRHLEGKYQQYKRDLNELAELGKSLPDIQAQIDKMNDELAAELYGRQAREQLSEIQARIDELDYDRQTHVLLKEEMVSLLPFSQKLTELTRALKEKPELERSLEECRQLRQEKDSRIETLKGESGQLEKQALLMPALKEELKAAEEGLEVLLQERDQLSKSVAVLENTFGQLEKELNELEKKKERLEEVTALKEDYVFLAEAFGKKGIQAVIIENAVPEIESEANRILARLSDNKMHIALVTQHKTKSGTISETLDILIGDEVGTRSYDLYSGGEAFKVNFALRIALSRLLARRAGARLETLIIDEGFGSQDASSRDRLVKAIKSIQADFSKIIVITHIVDVQEMFPTQIVVSKEFGVSNLKVVS
ncbi:MAG: hypothetical protein K8F91_06670, partial [Candidatus Obscuribacterales bacterium]|nr:hypothetical protein [Candidatus Obscuribacterales bacterium]